MMLKMPVVDVTRVLKLKFSGMRSTTGANAVTLLLILVTRYLLMLKMCRTLRSMVGDMS